jgi:hypothetical protein
MHPVAAYIRIKVIALYMAHVVASIMTTVVIVMKKYMSHTNTVFHSKVEIFKRRIIHKTHKKILLNPLFLFAAIKGTTCLYMIILVMFLFIQWPL